MRITMNSMYNQLTMDLGKTTSNLNDTNSTISSGKVFRRPSDKPVELTFALNIRGAVAETKQFQRNIQYGQAWAKATESAVTQIQDRLMRSKALAIQGANDSQSAESRKAIASEIQTILEEVVALGNTSLGGRYVLAGTKTKDYPQGQAPFMLDKDGNVTYNGNQEDITLNVAQGLATKINLDGHSALETSGIFEALDLLKTALNENSRADIENSVGDIDASIEHINFQLSKLGSISNSLDNRADMAETLTLNNKERLSDIQDTEMVEAFNSLKAYETAYQAALAAGARIMKTSLVDYI